MRGFIMAVPTGLAGLGLTLTPACAAPSHANPNDSSVLSELAGAVGAGDPASATALGQSVCPMLTEPAGNAAAAAAPLSGLAGGPSVSPEMAQIVTQIAVPIYCPQIVSELATGHVPELPHLPGVPTLPGM